MESLKRQIDIHEDKLEEAENKDLARYYKKEINAKEGDLDRKENQLKKQ